MPTYQISLEKRLDEIATKSASETGITVQQYLATVVREHLNRVENRKEGALAG